MTHASTCRFSTKDYSKNRPFPETTQAASCVLLFSYKISDMV